MTRGVLRVTVNAMMMGPQRNVFLVVALAAVIGGGILVWTMTGSRPVPSNNAVINTPVLNSTINDVVPPTNTTQPPMTNTEGPVNANVNTSTRSNPVTVTVSQATDDPTRYHGQYICLSGYYQSSFEFTAMSAGRKAGSREIIAPYVWTEVMTQVLPTDVVCVDPNNTGEKTCYSRETATICGVFSYSATGGLGHVGAYNYQLQNTTGTATQ